MLVSSFPRNGLSNDNRAQPNVAVQGVHCLARGYAAHVIKAISDLIVSLRRPSFSLYGSQVSLLPPSAIGNLRNHTYSTSCLRPRSKRLLVPYLVD